MTPGWAAQFTPRTKALAWWGAACLALLGWYGAGYLRPLIGFGQDRLFVAIDAAVVSSWAPLGPSLVLIVSLLVWLLILWRDSINPEKLSSLADGVMALAALLAATCLLRAISHWGPAGRAFPWLGLLWSPHLSWSLALAAPAVLFGPSIRPSLHGYTYPFGNRSIAGLLFVSFSAVYTAFVLYFCQMCLLHGDEGQYLRVAQSLVHDGDMDLGNNLEPGYTDEFHRAEFPLHQAPNSPSGKVYSKHPIGLSLYLAPAYWLGLELWQNPRLSSALAMVPLAAGCVALLYLWLVRLGYAACVGLLCAIVVGTTTPLALYSGQIYPDVPGLVVLLLCLAGLYHWQLPDGKYRDMGSTEPIALAGMTLLLWWLLLVHPRFLPAVAVPGSLVALQAWGSPRRRQCLAAAAGASAVGLAGLLYYNYAFSGHLLGNFLPSNMFSGGPVMSWRAVVPNLLLLWLEEAQGVLNTSPVFGLAIAGWLVMAIGQRDRRLLVVGAVYATTAGVTATVISWMEGYCIPGRYMIAAMPALAVGLAAAGPHVLRYPLLTLVAAFSLVVSWDGVVTALSIPELSLAGKHLAHRDITLYYPLAAHFGAALSSAFPLWPAVFWAGVAGGVVGGTEAWTRGRRGLAAAICLSTVLIPAMVGGARAVRDRLPDSVSPYSAPLTPEGVPKSTLFGSTYQVTAEPRSGRLGPDGQVEAAEGTEGADLLMSAMLPIMKPGVMTFRVGNVQLSGAPDAIVGHVVISHGSTARAASWWGKMQSWPLAMSAWDEGGGTGKADLEIETRVYSVSRGNFEVDYLGKGSLSANTRLSVRGTFRRAQFTETLHRQYPLNQRGDDGVAARMGLRDVLPPGHYRARFRFEGSVFETLFQVSPRPIVVALYTQAVDPSTRPGRIDLEWTMRTWMSLSREEYTVVPDTRFARPSLEKRQPPWWIAIPFLGPRALDLSFELGEASEIYLAVTYDGPAPLKLVDVAMYTIEERQ